MIKTTRIVKIANHSQIFKVRFIIVIQFNPTNIYGVFTGCWGEKPFLSEINFVLGKKNGDENKKNLLF